MSLVDEIERLGAAAERGEIGINDAAQRLREFSEGGLTLAGARSLLAGWREARARVKAEGMRSRAILRELGT
jgi:hypothetical protein